MLQVWVLYHLQIIGEAARALSSKLTQHYSQRVHRATIIHIVTNNY